MRHDKQQFVLSWAEGEDMQRGVTYLALDVSALIIAVWSSAQRSTRAATFAGCDATALGEVLLPLLLADLDLLLLAAAAQLVGLEGVLRLERRATVLGNVAIGHVAGVSRLLWGGRGRWKRGLG